MHSHEYLALPAPTRGQKVKGLKTPAERYAHEMTVLLNELAADGWEFWRCECLPSEERKGLTGTMTVQNHLLIFRRPRAEALAERPNMPEPVRTPKLATAPTPQAPASERADPPVLRRPDPNAGEGQGPRLPNFSARNRPGGAND